MIFGRKARAAEEAELERDEAIETEADLEDAADTDPDDIDEADEADETDEEAAEAALDPREDGPFDFEEVALDADEVQRITFGPVIITPFEGLGLQLHGNPETGMIQALLATYEESGLELALFAAPRSGSLADELREEIVEEATQGGGHAEEADGPFGPEVRRVMPIDGPEGEQLFHVSRVWLVDGPRWLLRGTLMGQAAMVEGEDAPADVFVEFFRNVVIRRDEAPRVPGELIQLALPEGEAPQG